MTEFYEINAQVSEDPICEITVTTTQMRDWLGRECGFHIGTRDPRINTNYPGVFMVAEDHEQSELPTEDGGNGPWCIVGDNLDALIRRAFKIWHDDPLSYPTAQRLY